MQYMQQRFDHADLRKAIAAVREARPFGTDHSTIEARLSQKLGVSAETITWKTQIESKWRGTVLVKARVPGRSESYVWKVDLARQAVIPHSDAAKAIK